MARRRHEPDEALGPVIDGTPDLATLAESLLRPPVAEEEEQEPEQEEEQEPQVIVLCGNSPEALAVARLARDCDFEIAVARREEPQPGDELAELADSVHVLENYDNFVSGCGIDNNHYVCVFAQNAGYCEHILSQCLPSEAAYIGLNATRELGREIFAKLKEQGAPDAELAAICCPMGLYIGAKTPEQQGVAILAEVLAARAGVLKRLRFKA